MTEEELKGLISSAKKEWYSLFETKVDSLIMELEKVHYRPGIILRFRTNASILSLRKHVWIHCLNALECEDASMGRAITAMDLTSELLAQGLSRSKLRYDKKKHTYILEHGRYSASKRRSGGISLMSIDEAIPFKEGVPASTYATFLKTFDAIVYENTEYLDEIRKQKNRLDIELKRRKLIQAIETATQNAIQQ